MNFNEFYKKKTDQMPKLMSYDAIEGGYIEDHDTGYFDWTNRKNLKIMDKIIIIKSEDPINPNTFNLGILIKETAKVVSGMKINLIDGIVVPGHNVFQIEMAVTNKENRGQGWGKLLYKTALDLCKILASDDTLYRTSGLMDGSAGIWKTFMPAISTVLNYHEQSQEFSSYDFEEGIKSENIYFISFQDRALADKTVASSQQKLNEMPAFQDAHLDNNEQGDDKFAQAQLKYYQDNATLVEKRRLKHYMLYFYDSRNPAVFAVDTKTNDVVGQMTSRKNSQNLPEISSLFVNDKDQRMGIGTLMYVMMINNFGGIISDRTLTGENGGGSFHMWELLAKEYKNCYVVAKNGGKTTITKVDAFTHDMMHSSNERFMVTVNPVPEETLNETPVIDNTNRSMSTPNEVDAEIDAERLQKAKTKGELLSRKKLGTFDIELYDIPNGLDGHTDVLRAFAIIPQTKKVVGMLTAIRNKKFPKAHSSFVYDNFQRKGLARGMYESIIDWSGGIISDASLTGGDKIGGSFELWQKLAKSYNSYIIYKSPTGDHIKPVTTFTNKDVQDSTSRFMFTKEPFTQK